MCCTKRTHSEANLKTLTQLSLSLSTSSSLFSSSPPNKRYCKMNNTSNLVCAASVSAFVGCHHDPNPKHRPSMEDETSIEMFEDFPGLFIGVYDGHGGKLAASLLRQLLHRFFLDELLGDTPPSTPDKSKIGSPVTPSSPSSACGTPPYDDIMDTCCLNNNHILNTLDLDVTNAFIRAYSRMDAALRTRRCFRVGATAVTCFIRKVPGVGRILTTANCGDTRAVLSRAGRPVRLSCDHRPCEQDERCRVEKAGGFVTCRRVNGILNVSRAFGDHMMKSVVVSTPSVNEIKLTNMDDFLVLACDGLWDFVDETTVLSIAQDGLDRGLDANQVAAELVDEAIRRKSTDNVSVSVVLFDMDDE